MKKIIAIIAVITITLSMIGCGKQNEPSDIAAEESILSRDSEETRKKDTSAAETPSEDLLGLEINGTALTFPFRVEELDKELTLTSKLYSESDNYTLCDLSTTDNTVLCSVFVQGKVPERTDSEVVGIIVDDMNDSISFHGLNNDTMTSYIKQYGEPNDQSDTIIEYTWKSIDFIVMFDSESHKANYVNLSVIRKD